MEQLNILDMVSEQPEPEVSEEDSLAPNEIIIAEGTEFERKITLRIPRGKQYRDKHRKLLVTFGELESVASSLKGADGNVQVKPIIDAIDKLFGYKDFEDTMIPFALGLETPEGREYLDNLLPMEKFMAYMSAATYIVSGGSNEQVRAALKK